PEIAHDLGISISEAGNFITAYALGVVVGAPLLTAVAVRLARKTMLLSMMGVFIASNALFAFVPTHEVCMLLRFAAGLLHSADIHTAHASDHGQWGRPPSSGHIDSVRPSR